MAEANLTIGGDPGGALAAIAAVQGALGGLTGKTVVVNVETKGGEAAIGALGGVRKGLDDGSESYGRHAAAAERATSSVARHAAVNERAAESTRTTAGVHDRASESVRAHGDAHRSASRDVDGMSTSMRRMKQDTANLDDGSVMGAFRKGVVDALGGTKQMEKSLDRIDTLATGAGGGMLGMIENVAGTSGVVRKMETAIAGSTIAAVGLTAGIARLGVEGIGALVAQTPALATGLRDVQHAFQQGIGDAGGQALRTTGSAMTALRSSAGDLGTTIGKVSADAMPAGLGLVSGLAKTATSAIQEMEPALVPSMKAVAANVGAVVKGVADATPGIVSFANAATAAAPGVQALATGATNFVTSTAKGVAGTIEQYGGDVPRLQQDSDSFLQKSEAWTDPLVGAHRNAGGTVDLIGANSKGTVGDELFGITRGSNGAASGAFNYGASGQANRQSVVDNARGAYDAFNPDNEANKGLPTGTDYGTGATVPLLGFSNSPHWDANKGESGQLGQPSSFVGPQAATQPTAMSQSGAIPKPSDLPSGDPTKDPNKTPLKAPQVGGGSSMGVETQQTRALTAAMNDATRATGQLGSSSSQTSRAVSAGMQGAGQSAQQLPQHVGQAASQMPAAVAQHAAQIPAAMAQPMAQVPKAAAAAIHPAAMVAPVQQAVQHVASQAPAASDAGSDVGSSVGEGMGKGITKTTTNTLTIVENWVTKIIKTAASVLDSHSPSRVFEGLGMSVGQGMELGVQKSTDLAVSATGSMMSGVVDAGAGALSSGGGGVSPSALSVGSLASGSAGNSSLASGGGLGGQLSSIIGGDGGSLSSASAQLNDHFGQLGQLGQSVAPTLQSTLLGPNGALGTLGKYTDGLQKAAGPQSAALRLMSDGNSQITGNPYSSGGGGKPQTDAEKQAQAEWTANRKDQLTKANRGFSDNTMNNIANNQWAHEVRREQILGRRDENHQSALYQVQHPGVNRQQAMTEYEAAKQRQADAPKGPNGQTPALNMRSPQQIASDNLAQQAQQRQQQQAQQQKTLREASDPRTAALTGIGGSFGPPPQISDLQRNKGQAAAGADGRAVGQSYGDGLSSGLKDSHGKAQTSAGQVTDALNDEVKKKAGINSPSTVWAGYGGDLVAGLTGGMGGALTGASSGISGIADNTGLQVGFLWAKGVQDGIQRQFKSADFQSDAAPQLSSQQALTALGIGGQLGASGGGGLVNKNPSVTINASGSGSQQPIQLAVMLDGQPFYDYVTTAVNSAFDQYADSQLRN